MIRNSVSWQAFDLAFKAHKQKTVELLLKSLPRSEKLSSTPSDNIVNPPPESFLSLKHKAISSSLHLLLSIAASCGASYFFTTCPPHISCSTDLSLGDFQGSQTPPKRHSYSGSTNFDPNPCLRSLVFQQYSGFIPSIEEFQRLQNPPKRLNYSCSTIFAHKSSSPSSYNSSNTRALAQALKSSNGYEPFQSDTIDRALLISTRILVSILLFFHQYSSFSPRIEDIERL